MVGTVYKYVLGGSVSWLKMPEDAQLLRAGVQNGQIVVWALVDVARPEVQRRVEAVNTGVSNLAGVGVYVDTVTVGEVVWHIWDYGEVERNDAKSIEVEYAGTQDEHALSAGTRDAVAEALLEYHRAYWAWAEAEAARRIAPTEISAARCNELAGIVGERETALIAAAEQRGREAVRRENDIGN